MTSRCATAPSAVKWFLWNVRARRMRGKTSRLIFAAMLVGTFAGSEWPCFRGTDGRGVSDEVNLPKTFGDNENVAWRVPLPGRGPSGPIVVGGRVIVTAASGPRQDRLHVLALDAGSGELIWHRKLWATGSSLHNDFGGVAANTPASDRQRVFAFFSSNDLACFDLDGNLLWLRGLGYETPNARNDVGMASSPLVVGDVVIVQLDSEAEAFAAGLDTANGETRWRIPHPKGALWSSPTVLRGRAGGKDFVLMQSRSRLAVHDARTGELAWDYETQCHTMASVTTCDGMVYLPANGLHALQPDPEQGVRLLWYEPRLRSRAASPIVHQGRTYTIKSPGILVCGDAADGTVLWQLRLKGPFWASGVLADGHLYAVNHDGLVQVVRLGEKGELVGTGQIEPGILASPAVADGAIYFRTNERLWKVAFD